MRLFKIGDRVTYNSPTPSDIRNKKAGEVVSERTEANSGMGLYTVKFDDDNISYATCADGCLTLENNVAPSVLEPVTQQEGEVIDVTPHKMELIEAPIMAESLLYTPLQIQFDKDKYIGYATAIQSQYKGLVLTADNEAEIKSISTALGKMAKELNAERISVEKELSPPLKKLKADVDEVIKIITDTQLELKKQLDESSGAKRDKKRAEVQVIIDGFKKSSNLPPEYITRVVLKDEYLTATISMKKIKDDITGQINQLEEDHANEVKAKQADIDLAKNREMMYNALCAAFPDVSLMLGDLTHVEMQNFAQVFAERRAQLQVQQAVVPPVEQYAAPAAFTLPPSPVQEAPIPTWVTDTCHGIPVQPTQDYYIDIRVRHIGGVDATQEAAILLIDLAEQNGLDVELLTQI